MSHSLVLRAEAEKDIAEAAEWYERQRPGLSLQFRAALDSTFAAIEQNPLLYAEVYRGFRRGLVRHFPYGVFYLTRAESVVVVAVFHCARDPKLWRARRTQGAG
jgi:plasmid stabilization system protein ParE